LDAGLATLLCKRIIIVRSKEVKPESNLAEPSKKVYGSKMAVLPMMMTMMMMRLRRPMKTSARVTGQWTDNRSLELLSLKQDCQSFKRDVPSDLITAVQTDAMAILLHQFRSYKPLQTQYKALLNGHFKR
jgi:hypothetical protein